MEIDAKVMKVRDLLELKKSGMLKVNAEYQRAAVWTELQQKRLIDSVLRCYPLPLFYLDHKVRNIAGMRSEDLEIIDGQQRINALYRFSENAFRLLDPIKDDKAARFPKFIKESDCPWAHCNFLSLPAEFKDRFLDTPVSVVKITTSVEDEARDLFIRLQAGLPLNAQEKRDAWPGGFTELVLKLGGKQEIERYPGHDFFRRLVKRSGRDRGAERQLCAQICMLFLERAAYGNWIDIGTQDIDDYYYRNLGFDVNDQIVVRLSKVLDLAVQLFNGQDTPKLRAYEAIHVVMLLDGLMDDYTKSWYGNFIRAYDAFKLRLAEAKEEQSGQYWTEFGALTQTQSAGARTIQRRHVFFLREMHRELGAILLDPTRIFGEIEREIIYFRNDKRCAVCGQVIRWADLEIHHVTEYRAGGSTCIENGAPVHKDCHPKGASAVAEFEVQWGKRREIAERPPLGSSNESSGNDQLNSRLPPEGTRCRFAYGTTEYRGTVADGRIELDDMPGRSFGSLSAASVAVTGTNRNGWHDWDLLVPGSDDWILADTWRNS